MVQIVLGFPRDHAAQQQHRDQVGHRHERVEDVGDRPRQIERQHRADHDDRDEHQLIRQHALAAEQILAAALAIVRPAEDGRIGEGDDADHENQRADHRDL